MGFSTPHFVLLKEIFQQLRGPPVTTLLIISLSDVLVLHRQHLQCVTLDVVSSLLLTEAFRDNSYNELNSIDQYHRSVTKICRTTFVTYPISTPFLALRRFLFYFYCLRLRSFMRRVETFNCFTITNWLAPA